MTRLSAAEYREQATPKRRGRFPVVAKARRTADGIVFDSLGEMNRYLKLKQWEKAGIISRLECQQEFPVWINGIKVCTFTADFQYVRDGAVIIEDRKSSGTQKDPSYRIRKRCAEAYYGIKIEEVIR